MVIWICPQQKLSTAKDFRFLCVGQQLKSTLIRMQSLSRRTTVRAKTLRKERAIIFKR